MKINPVARPRMNMDLKILRPREELCRGMREHVGTVAAAD